MADNEVPQTGATPRWINLTPLPQVPDWIRIILEKDDPSWYILQKLDNESFCEMLIWELARAQNPHQLEEGREYVADFLDQLGCGDRQLFDDVYNTMWNYFLGGLS